MLFLTFCTSAPKAPVRPDMIQRESLLPNGTYHHSISLYILGTKKDFSFKGIVSLSDETIKVMGLSMFGTTEFRLEENRKTGHVNIEFFRDALKKAEPKIREYYKTIRIVLTTGKDGGNADILKRHESGFPEEMKAESARYTLKDYDQNLIPKVMKVDHPEFRVSVKVTEYEI